MDKGVDDTKTPLSNIAQCHGKPIVSLLLDIQKNQQPQTKYLRFIRHLECLSVDESSREELVQPIGSLVPRRWGQRTTLIRREIDAFKERDYVALSYTWERSHHENQSSGKYEVQTRDKHQFFSSPVRDCVFDRVLSYMWANDLGLLWIDRHCVKQKTCGKKGVCYHARCNQKQDAIQTMDLVYKLSKHPVALLGKPIEWQDELDLLVKILTGQLVYKPQGTTKFQLSQTTSHDEASRALGLLSRITKDRWWTRAWTFQENYRAGANMTLLIRHPPFLEVQKRSYGLFPDVSCEICIKSVDFCKASTELCLAVHAQTPLQADASYHADQVLAVIGKYTVFLDRSKSMTPYVITDIQTRGLSDAWDKLAIIANCCQYAIRMDNRELKIISQSLSLSILAMCLLNGEILHNGVEEDPTSMSDMTVSQYLKAQAFKEFYAPRSERDLTFNKGCRFVEVQLKQSGIKTRGHLWKLGSIIHTARFRLPLSGAEKPSCSLTPGKQGRLTQLVAELRLFGEASLASQIERYLNHDSTRSGETFKNEAFPKRYTYLMAEELAAAIENGKSLRLGRIWDALEPEVPCSAIFVWDSSRTEESNIGEKPREANTRSKGDRGSQEAFVFTAMSPMTRGSQQHGTNDLDHHVSLEVSWPLSGRQAPNRLPRLYIKRWLLGLCFFYGYTRTDVIFPWPSALQATIP